MLPSLGGPLKVIKNGTHYPPQKSNLQRQGTERQRPSKDLQEFQNSKGRHYFVCRNMVD